MRFIPFAALLLAAPGCGVFASSEWVVRPGYIGAGIMSVLVAPDSVGVDEPFVITVTTFGSSSCTRPSGVEVSQSALAAEVMPLDSVRVGGDVACTRDLAPLPRDIELVFTAAGVGTVRVTGEVGGERDSTVERAILVVGR